MLEVRVIGTTIHHTFDELEQFLTEVDHFRPRRVFSTVEEGSRKYELITGFVSGRESVHLYLSPEPLDRSPFRTQQQHFQRYLSQREIPLLRGKIEVAAKGEILEFFEGSEDWQRVIRARTSPPITMVEYNGGVYIAFIGDGYAGIHALTPLNQPLAAGMRVKRLQPHSDLGL